MATSRRAGGKPSAQPRALVLPAELTIYHAATIRGDLAAAVAAGQRQFDLGHVTEFDSAGLQLLLAARRSVAAAGALLELSNPSRAVLDVAATYALNERLQHAGNESP
jgi:anti-sigma B factor antagonist